MTGDGRRTVLLAWELGVGHGHLTRLLALGRHLIGEGWRPVAAVAQPIVMAGRFRAAGIPVLPAPSVPLLRHTHPPASYADLLAITSYRDADMLAAHVQCWEDVIDLVRPAAIVGDYAPVLALAAHGRVPFVAVGTGFTVPPNTMPRFPNLRPGASGEDRVIATVEEVQRRRGAPAPPSLPRLVAGDDAVVATLPELDLYARLRPVKATGPIGATPEQLPPAPAPAIFAYLEGSLPGIGRVLDALAATALTVTAYLRGGAPPPRPGIAFLTRPADMNEMLGRVSLLVHHGGCSTAEQGLLAGRPQFLLPRYDEQELTARQLERLGIGALPVRGESAVALAQRMAAIAVSAEWRQRAQDRAATAQAQRPWTSAERVAEACRRLAA